MPYYFAASGARIQLDEAADAVGVRFGGETGPAVSKAASRSLARSARAGTQPVMRFGRFMLLRDSRAADAPVETVVNALPKKLASRVSRTMPVFVERESQLKLVATEQILASFNSGAPHAKTRKLLDGL